MTVQIKNKPEHLTQTYNFKHVINHVDIIQAEAEFVEKYSHLLDNNNLITRTLVDYETKTITIEAYSTSLFHPRKDNKGFIFDLKTAPNVNIKELVKVFEPLGIVEDDLKLYPNSNYLIITSNKLTKDIIQNAKKVIELENRTETFKKTYKFDKRPSVQDLLQSQLKFITDNKLHEDDIIFVVINTDDEDFVNNNTITITGKQNSKYKTYSNNVAAIINSCIIVDRFDSCLESALKEGSDNVIQRVIKYQHPIVDNLELLESSVDVNSSLKLVDEVVEFIRDTSSDINELLTSETANTFNVKQFANIGSFDMVSDLPIKEVFTPLITNVDLGSFKPQVDITQVLEDITNKDGDIESKSEVIESSIKDNLSTNFSIADFATETLPEPEPQYPVVETGDKIYEGKVQTSFELQEVTFGQPDKLSLSDLARKSKDSFYIKLTSSKTNNEKLIDVLELTEDDYYYTKDQTAITITSNHVTVDFIKDKIKQLGGHSKLMPPNEIRVFTYSNDNDLDVSNLTSVKVFFDNLIQRYSDKYNVKIKPIKFEVDVNTNYASATVEITPNYLRQSTNVEAIIITTLYNALLLKQIIEGNTLSLREV